MTKIPEKALRVAVGQMAATDNVVDNIAQIFSLLGQVPDPSLVDLFAFPENALYMRLSRTARVQGFDLSESCFGEFTRFCTTHQTEIVLGSVPVQFADGLRNSMVHISALGPKVVYNKIHLFDVDVKGAPPVRESDTFRHGQETNVLTIKGWQIGLSICYDLRFAELYSRYAKLGVHAILVPSSFLVPTGAAHWHVLLRARAIESQAFVLAPAQGGEHRNQAGEVRQTFGHSLVISPWGDILAEAQKSPEILVVDLDPRAIEQFQRQVPMPQHRRL